jgi:hypothetical protein
MVLMSDQLKEFVRRGVAAQKAANDLIREWHLRRPVMPFPKTRDEMEKAGYTRDIYTRCKGCQQSIEFWITPAGRKIPMDFMRDPETPAISHFATCPKAAQFRKKASPDSPQDAPAEPRRP